MKQLLFYCLLLAGFFIVLPFFTLSYAATLELDPTTVSTTVGQTFSVKLKVNAGTQKVKSADAWVIYDKNILEAVSVDDGDYFGTDVPTSKDTSTAGKVYVSGMVSDETLPVSGTGIMATINFKALTDGTNVLEFDCTDGSTDGSMILQADDTATNLIECSKNVTSTVTVGNGATTTPATNNDLTPSSAVPTALPRSGVFENVTNLAIPGAILLIIGTAARLLL